ncbi:MAG: LD-carboxypeptidase [Crocinitomicaceae bacterium]|nr:LD-carboxypeptidase [Crocinitomicaceae bacterium]
MRRPNNLEKGDLIYIVSPAKSIDQASVEFAKQLIESWGFIAECAAHSLGEYNYFSGNDTDRTSDFQLAIDHQEAKAILCARGGYGCVRIVDELNWSNFEQFPKWIIGFSDITVLHHRAQRLSVMSMHATMPLNFSVNSKQALETFRAALTGESFSISVPVSSLNKLGIARGRLVGGNLSIIYSLIGTTDAYDFKDSILFIEDLSEQLYHIDRMLFALKKAGVFDEIKALVIGGMTDLKDTNPSFGMTYEESILEKVKENNLPVCFNFPSGHIEDNRAMIIGAMVELEVNEQGAKLCYI